jgi:hypothetical protein
VSRYTGEALTSHALLARCRLKLGWPICCEFLWRVSKRRTGTTGARGGGVRDWIALGRVRGGRGHEAVLARHAAEGGGRSKESFAAGRYVRRRAWWCWWAATGIYSKGHGVLTRSPLAKLGYVSHGSPVWRQRASATAGGRPRGPRCVPHDERVRCPNAARSRSRMPAWFCCTPCRCCLRILHIPTCFSVEHAQDASHHPSQLIATQAPSEITAPTRNEPPFLLTMILHSQCPAGRSSLRATLGITLCIIVYCR